MLFIEKLDDTTHILYVYVILKYILTFQLVKNRYNTDMYTNTHIHADIEKWDLRIRGDNESQEKHDDNKVKFETIKIT